MAFPGVELRPSRFGGEGEAFCLGRREFAHFHVGNELDLRLTKAEVRTLRDALDGDDRATVSGGGDWVELRFSRRPHLDWVMAFVQRAVEANR